ncbi:MAG: ATP-grasp domain-containing protein [Marinagarivorans sp.]
MADISILVLDGAQRSALAVTRSLGCLEWVRVTTAEQGGFNLAGASRFSQEALEYPCPQTQPGAFIAWIKQIIAERRFDWVFPVTEITSQLLLMHQEQIPHLRLPFAHLAQVAALADKGKLTQMAQQLGVPVPASQFYADATGLNPQQLNFPLVVKPCLSKIFAEDHWISTSVFVAHDAAQLTAELHRRPYLNQHSFMLQEFIPGAGAGVFALYNQGQAVAFFAHKRLREKPPEGGISVLSASAAVTPQLEAYARKLLDAVHWHGVAMVEFRETPQGEFYLMEVNTRFWGSLQLAIDSGVDFPALLLRACMGEPMPAQVPYKIGQKLRWLLGDVDSLYIYLKRPHSIKAKALRVLAFLTPCFTGLRYEVNRWGDLGPAWRELKYYFIGR